MTNNGNNTSVVISILNMKGGVGKTTLTKEIGYHLARRKNKKVLLIDVDPQINLTQALFKLFGFAQTKEIAQQMLDEEDQDENPESEISSDHETSKNYELQDNPIEKKAKKALTISEASIQNVFNSSVTSPATEDVAIQKLTDNLFLVPGDLGIEFTLRNLNSGKIENGIHDFIKKNRLREKFEYIIIDCPPTYSSYTIAALKPSDYLLIPVKPESYSITGVDMLLKVINSVVSENDPYFENKPLKNLGIVYTDIMQSPSKGTQNLMKDIRTSKILSKHNLHIFETTFLSNPYLKTKLDYFIDSSNSEKSKQNLSILVDEILERIDELE